MTNLVQITSQEVVVSSRQVAEHFEKEHKTVLRNIHEILAAQNCATKFFHESTYDNRGKLYPEYLMTRDGFTLLVMSFTGKVAMDWKIKYINAFNEMEKQLKTGNAKPLTESQEKRYAVMERNAKIKEAALWAKLAADSNGTYKEICRAYAANTLAGREVLSLPQVAERTYTATDVGKLLGVSANRVGKIAKAHNLKTDEYGNWYHDKAKNCSKEVEVFRYNEHGIDKIRQYLVDAHGA